MPWRYLPRIHVSGLAKPLVRVQSRAVGLFARIHDTAFEFHFHSNRDLLKDRSTRYIVVPAPLGIEPNTIDLPFNTTNSQSQLFILLSACLFCHQTTFDSRKRWRQQGKDDWLEIWR